MAPAFNPLPDNLADSRENLCFFGENSFLKVRRLYRNLRARNLLKIRVLQRVDESAQNPFRVYQK